MAPELTYASLLARVADDPTVVGLLLKGSHAHDGMATEHSDRDVYIVLADETETGPGKPGSRNPGAPKPGPRNPGLRELDGHRSADLDVVVITLDAFRRLGGYERYALARARIVIDRLDGGIAEIVAAKGRLDDEEAFRAAAGWLDAYANSLYRSVKNARDGHPLAAHLDAADSVGFLLELLFALDGRPRPYNKYLEWELTRVPLPGWETEQLLETIGQIVGTGDTAFQRRLFTRVETVARQAGHGPTLDAWGEDLHLMRIPPRVHTEAH
ncbi:hypothetical protein ACWD4G_09055 [Streptomyces sp. NPDC002643]